MSTLPTIDEQTIALIDYLQEAYINTGQFASIRDMFTEDSLLAAREALGKQADQKDATYEMVRQYVEQAQSNFQDYVADKATYPNLDGILNVMTPDQLNQKLFEKGAKGTADALQELARDPLLALDGSPIYTPGVASAREREEQPLHDDLLPMREPIIPPEENAVAVDTEEQESKALAGGDAHVTPTSDAADDIEALNVLEIADVDDDTDLEIVVKGTKGRRTSAEIRAEMAKQFFEHFEENPPESNPAPDAYYETAMRQVAKDVIHDKAYDDKGHADYIFTIDQGTQTMIAGRTHPGFGLEVATEEEIYPDVYEKQFLNDSTAEATMDQYTLGNAFNMREYKEYRTTELLAEYDPDGYQQMGSDYQAALASLDEADRQTVDDYIQGRMNDTIQEGVENYPPEYDRVVNETEKGFIIEEVVDTTVSLREVKAMHEARIDALENLDFKRNTKDNSADVAQSFTVERTSMPLSLEEAEITREVSVYSPENDTIKGSAKKDIKDAVDLLVSSEKADLARVDFQLGLLTGEIEGDNVEKELLRTVRDVQQHNYDALELRGIKSQEELDDMLAAINVTLESNNIASGSIEDHADQFATLSADEINEASRQGQTRPEHRHAGGSLSAGGMVPQAGGMVATLGGRVTAILEPGERLDGGLRIGIRGSGQIGVDGNVVNPADVDPAARSEGEIDVRVQTGNNTAIHAGGAAESTFIGETFEGRTGLEINNNDGNAHVRFDGVVRQQDIAGLVDNAVTLGGEVTVDATIGDTTLAANGGVGRTNAPDLGTGMSWNAGGSILYRGDELTASLAGDHQNFSALSEGSSLTTVAAGFGVMGDHDVTVLDARGNVVHSRSQDREFTLASGMVLTADDLGPATFKLGAGATHWSAGGELERTYLTMRAELEALKNGTSVFVEGNVELGDSGNLPAQEGLPPVFKAGITIPTK